MLVRAAPADMDAAEFVFSIVSALHSGRDRCLYIACRRLPWRRRERQRILPCPIIFSPGYRRAASRKLVDTMAKCNLGHQQVVTIGGHGIAALGGSRCKPDLEPYSLESAPRSVRHNRLTFSKQYSSHPVPRYRHLFMIAADAW